MDQNKFWAVVDEMERDASEPGKNMPVMATDLQFMADFLRQNLGIKEATSFTRLCIHLSEQKADTKNVIAMLRDLRDHDWNYGRTLRETKTSQASRSFLGHNFDKATYPSYITFTAIAPQVRLFAKNNYELLSNNQQEALRILAPERIP